MEDYSEVQNLKRIDFSSKKIKNLDSKIIKRLKSLQYINFSSNQLTQLDSDLFNGLYSLWDINFSSNQITQLDSNLFKGLASLIWINFSANQIKQLDSDLFKGLNSLRELNFSSNQIILLDSEIFNGLYGLRQINLSSNQIKQLDSNIFKSLTNLTRIDFSSNQIAQLDSNIFKGLTGLTWIDFSSNQIAQLDSEIFNGLNSLTEINFSDNQLTQLDSDLFKGLASLKCIHFSSNRIAQLDSNLFKGLASLTWIDFSSNQIKQLDSEIFFGLNSLRELNFSSNQLTKLDCNIIQGLDNLRLINFSNNKLTSFSPQFFSNLSSLEIILFNSNFFTRIPSNFFYSLKKLKQIDLHFDYSFLYYDYISIFELFFSIDGRHKYDCHLGKYSFEPNYKTSVFFKEFINMFCLSKKSLYFSDETNCNDYGNLEKLFTSSDSSKFVHYYGDNYTPLDFLLEIKSVSNNTISNILKHGKYIFDNYKFNISETDFQIRNIQTINHLCQRNNQQIMDEIGDFFYVDDFAQCFEICVQEDSEMVAIFLFDLFIRRVFSHPPIDSKQNDCSSFERKLTEMNFLLNDCKKYRFLEQCFNKKWWNLFHKILNYQQQQINNDKRKTDFFLLFENTFKEGTSNSNNDIQIVIVDNSKTPNDENLMWDTIQNASSNHILHFIASSAQSRLIKHPTTVEFLHLKWKNLPSAIYYFHFVLFLLLIVAYSLNMEFLREPDSSAYLISRHISIVLVSIFFIEEIVQMLISTGQYSNNTLGRILFNYFKSSQNVLELIYPICFIFLLIDSVQVKTTAYSFIILFLYAILILRLEKFPVVGIYVTVFKRIFSRSAKVLPLIILASLAFLLSFRINSLRFDNDSTNQYNFNGSFTLTLIHLMTLNLGDFGNDKMGLNDHIDESNWHIYVIYLVFLFIIPILILNIFIGISVDEMKKLIDQSHEYNTRIKIDYTLKMQDALFGVRRLLFYRRCTKHISDIYGKFISWAVLINENKINVKSAKASNTKHKVNKREEFKIDEIKPEDTSRQLNKFEEKFDQKIAELNTDIEKVEKRLKHDISKEMQRLNNDYHQVLSSLENLEQTLNSSGLERKTTIQFVHTSKQLNRLDNKMNLKYINKIKKQSKNESIKKLQYKLKKDNEKILSNIDNLTKLVEILNSGSPKITVRWPSVDI